MKRSLTYITLMLIFISTNLISQEVSYIERSGDDRDMYYGGIIGSYGNSVVFQSLKEGVLYYTDGTSSGTNEVSGLNGFEKVKYTLNVDSSLYVVTEHESYKYSLIKFTENLEPTVILSGWEFINKLILYDGKLFLNGKKPDESKFFFAMDLNDNTLTQHASIHWLIPIQEIVIFKDNLYYISGTQTNKFGLYKFNTSLTDSELVYDFKQNNGFYTNINLIATDDYLFFTYLDRNGDYSLFSSDGTTNGTKVLDNTISHESWFDIKENKGAISYNNKLYIRTTFDNDDKRYLLESDGTVEGTKKMALGSELNIWPSDMVIIDDILYMIGLGEVLSIDKATGNLEKVLGNSINNDISELENFRNSLCFIEEDNNNNNKNIWLSDIASGQSKKINLFADNHFIQRPLEIVSAGDNLYFIGLIPSYGLELFVYSDTTGISSTASLEYSDFNVFPNPATNQINFSTELTNSNIAVFDIQGRKVISESNHVESALDISRLEVGTYFMEIDHKGRLYRSKFVIKR